MKHCTVIAVFIVLLSAFPAHAKKIHNRHYKFAMEIPGSMQPTSDSADVTEADLYYDTTAKVLLMISTRHSKFHSVQDYIDCTKAQLESELKYFYSDSSLRLISCNRSPYYPKKATVLIFGVNVLPYGFNTCTVYFIHHRHKDVQLSFTYKKESSHESAQYIDRIMQTLRLR